MGKLLLVLISFCTTIATVGSVTYNWKWEITVNKDQPKTSAVIIFTTHPEEQSSLLFDEFVGGQNYTDLATFSVKETKGSAKDKESVGIQAVYFVFEQNGTCPPPKAAKTLKLDRVSVRFIRSQNKTFEKVSKDIELTLSCKNATEKVVVLKDFKETTKKDCIFFNKYYEHKEKFDDECRASCSCDDGNVGCVDLCGVYTADWSKCHSVKSYGQCCSHAQCVDDLQSLKCDTTDVGPNFKPPWAVEIFVANESQPNSAKRVCAATIINKNWILTQSSCANSNEKSSKVIILHPISLSNSVNVTKVVLDNTENETRAHLALIRVEPRIEFTEGLHQVNLPWPSECPKYANSSCTYYMQSFSGVINGAFKEMKANKTDSKRCSLQENHKPVVCLEMDAYPNCPNLAGTSVTVERSGGFYLTGFLYDSSAKYETGCDINRGKFRPMISICKRLSWIKNVTMADDDN